MESAPNIIQFPRTETPEPTPPHPQREKRREVGRKDIINKINALNFTDDSLLLYLRHRKFSSIMSLRGKPDACLSDTVTCTLEGADHEDSLGTDYEVSAVIISDSETSFLLTPETISFSPGRISFSLPDSAIEFTHRHKVRHQSADVSAKVVADGIIFSGKLVNFTDTAINVQIHQESGQTFRWIGHTNELFLILEMRGNAVFSANCKLIKQWGESSVRTLILSPQSQVSHRFRKRKFRSSRHKLLPSPQVIFLHPLTGKKTKHRIANISGSGFAIEENPQTSALLPGLVVESAEIVFTNSFRLSCKFQVIHKAHDAAPATAGCAILDMDVESHINLVNILHQTGDSNLNVCSEDVDLDELWEFFFKTGFLYQQKYAFVSRHKDAFKNLYQRLYGSNPHIARHFIIEENSTIQAHMSMIRVYDKTWMIHHHAALKGSRRNGIAVLNHLNRSIIDSDNLASSKMDYICCYYRPENKFPNKVFGGVVKHINDKAKASTDSFAYFHYRRSEASPAVPQECGLTKATFQDICDLQSSYRSASGGLMMGALNIEPDQSADASLSREYEEVGFSRNRIFMSFRKAGKLKAVIVLNISDIGINMSDFTNCIQVFVVDRDEFTENDLFGIIHLMSVKFRNDPVTVLVHPFSFVAENSIPHEKRYDFFAIATDYADDYFDFLKNIFPSIGL